MKKLQCYVASSFDELNKKCGYGVIMKEECRPIDIISGFTEESWQIKSYQVGGYLIGVLKVQRGLGLGVQPRQFLQNSLVFCLIHGEISSTRFPPLYAFF